MIDFNFTFLMAFLPDLVDLGWTRTNTVKMASASVSVAAACLVVLLSLAMSPGVGGAAQNGGQAHQGCSFEMELLSFTI